MPKVFSKIACRCNELFRENEDLRQQINSLQDTIYQLKQENNNLQASNSYLHQQHLITHNILEQNRQIETLQQTLPQRQRNRSATYYLGRRRRQMMRDVRKTLSAGGPNNHATNNIVSPPFPLDFDNINTLTDPLNLNINQHQQGPSAPPQQQTQENSTFHTNNLQFNQQELSTPPQPETQSSSNFGTPNNNNNHYNN